MGAKEDSHSLLLDRLALDARFQVRPFRSLNHISLSLEIEVFSFSHILLGQQSQRVTTMWWSEYDVYFSCYRLWSSVK